MPSPDSMSVLETVPDAELVAATLAGDRRAFGRIVERYQRLLCSLAYSATGELSQSEDLAQEAFVDAWRQLADLREPDKLRAWLCGILRFKISRLRRADGREPVRRADPLEAAETVESGEEPAAAVAIHKEEQALMWSALERVPEIYREPLVLYYREHCSVEHVAVALDLTEDAVKQRLARGRKVLQEQVLAFVEGALARSTPGKLFTIGVLAALPAIGLPTTAQAAAVGVGAGLAAHGSALAKTTALATLLASVSGVVSSILALRAGLDQSRTPRERRAVVKVTIAFVAGGFGFIGLLWLLRAGAWRWWDQRFVFAGMAQVLVIGFLVIWPFGLMRMLRCMRRMRSEERRAHPELFRDARDQRGSSAGEYRSRLALFGVPLVHIRFSSPDEGESPTFGWFAGGDRAYGLVMAWGAYAVAPVSVGSVAIGFVAIGNFSAGVLSLGTVALGWVAIGCASVGFKAFGWLSALGWHSAQCSGFGIARVAAEASVAFAEHANDAAARAILANPQGEAHHMLVISVMTILSLVPVGYYARAVRQRLGRQGPGIRKDR
ncbi:MAG TPA: sigma-70 family RNA polymerase sigma factor [Lacunisphaera sp.]|nr:sigma-70 family RNA polymerase sigma factor [Lacunisphaera sp.]